MKQQCCPNVSHRKITRSVHKRSRDVAREIANTPQYKPSRRDRKKVEMLFAHLKRILKLDRLRLVLPLHFRTRPIRNVAPVVRVERGASAQPVAA